MLMFCPHCGAYGLDRTIDSDRSVAVCPGAPEVEYVTLNAGIRACFVAVPPLTSERTVSSYISAFSPANETPDSNEQHKWLRGWLFHGFCFNGWDS
jgi:hypothetical protein